MYKYVFFWFIIKSLIQMQTMCLHFIFIIEYIVFFTLEKIWPLQLIWPPPASSLSSTWLSVCVTFCPRSSWQSVNYLLFIGVWVGTEITFFDINKSGKIYWSPSASVWEFLTQNKKGYWLWYIYNILIVSQSTYLWSTCRLLFHSLYFCVLFIADCGGNSGTV